MNNQELSQELILSSSQEISMNQLFDEEFALRGIRLPELWYDGFVYYRNFPRFAFPRFGYSTGCCYQNFDEDMVEKGIVLSLLGFCNAPNDWVADYYYSFSREVIFQPKGLSWK